METTHTRIYRPHLARLRERAAAERRSVLAVLTMILEKELKPNGRERRRPAAARVQRSGV